MIPSTLNNETLIESEEYESLPSTTYRLDFVNRRIIGVIDGSEAVMQFIKKVLNTDKYAYSIYDWYYGNELLKLVGMPYDYIRTECPRIIEEALLADDRILSVENFEFSKLSIDSLSVSCIVRTVYGTLHYTQEVSI